MNDKPPHKTFGFAGNPGNYSKKIRLRADFYYRGPREAVRLLGVILILHLLFLLQGYCKTLPATLANLTFGRLARWRRSPFPPKGRDMSRILLQYMRPCNQVPPFRLRYPVVQRAFRTVRLKGRYVDFYYNNTVIQTENILWQKF